MDKAIAQENLNLDEATIEKIVKKISYNYSLDSSKEFQLQKLVNQYLYTNTEPIIPLPLQLVYNDAIREIRRNQIMSFKITSQEKQFILKRRKVISNIMDEKQLLDKVQKLYDKAVREGSVKYKGNKYDLFFEPKEGIYLVFLNGEEFTRFNTRKITQAKKWLKEYLDN